MPEVMSGPITTGLFWDCNCYSNYIHPKTEPVCDKCGAREEDQPDSILEEVIGWLAGHLQVPRTSKDVERLAPVVADLIGGFHENLIQAGMTAWINVPAIAMDVAPDCNDLRIGLKLGESPNA